MELVGALWHTGLHTLFLLAAGDFRENHLLAKHGFDFLLDKTEFVERVGPEGNIKSEAEEAFGANLKLVAEFFGVVDGGFKFWVANPSLFGVDVHGSFELGDFFAKVFHDDASVDGVNIHRDVEDFVDIDKWRKPTGVERAGITVYI